MFYLRSRIKRKIYRAKEEGTYPYYYYLLTTINDNTTTTYTDNVADDDLSYDGTFKGNTTSGKLFVGGYKVINICDVNTFIGKNSGNNNITGHNNTFIGQDSGFQNTIGYSNIFIGGGTGVSNKEGYNNIFIGSPAGSRLINGARNIFIGEFAGYNVEESIENIFIGNYAGYNFNVLAGYNTFIGEKAGYSVYDGSSNVFLGYKAGYYETGSSKLFIDNQQRANESDARVKALIYGEFDSDPANQLLRINGTLDLNSKGKISNLRSGWLDPAFSVLFTYQQLPLQ